MLVPNDQGQFILQGEGGWEVTDEDLSGQTVCIPSGAYSHMNFQGLKGSEGAPILITNCGQGRVVIDAEGAYAALGADRAAHLRILGTGDPGEPYGFHFKNAGSWTAVIKMKEGATHIEIGYVEVEGPGYTGIAIQAYPYCDASLGRDSFTQYDTHVHHSYVHGVSGEGLYLGPSHYHEEISPTSISAACPEGFPEAALRGVEVHHNVIEDTGRDAIQVGAAIEGMRIHDNIIRRYALQGDWGHTGGIQINPGSVGHVFNNHIDATGLETFDNAFQVAGGVDGPTYIYNNVVIGSEVPFLKLNRMGNPESPVYVMNNTFVLNPERSSTLSIACAEAWEQPFFITNNIFTEYAYVGTFIYENVDGVAYSKIIGDQNDNCPINGEIYLNGPDTDQQIPGNLYLKDSQDVGFAALHQGDYHLLADSPAVGTGEDLSDLVTDDYDGQARPAGPFDQGAYVYIED
ncbi:MAG: hypothetical protein ACPGU1_15790 [Myxococcota bacterium]